MPESLKDSHKAQWNDFVNQSPNCHFMQMTEWGDFKERTGWEVSRIALFEKKHIVAGAQIFYKSLPVLPLKIAYIPKGPICHPENNKRMSALFEAIHEEAKGKKAIFLRIEPNLPDQISFERLFHQMGFSSTNQTNQPRCSIRVNLAGGEDAVFARMKSQTRRFIRKGLREGVIIEKGNADAVSHLVNMIKKTEKRTGIPFHDLDYFQAMIDSLKETVKLQILLAKYQGRVVGANLMLKTGKTAIYFFGGNDPDVSAVRASYVLQWAGIQWAIEEACDSLDQWGIPDEVSSYLRAGEPIPNRRQGGLWGVYTFKKGFAGDEECYSGTYDFPYHPILYRVFVVWMAKHFSTDSLASFAERFKRLSPGS